MRECLRSAAATLPSDWRIVALVHDVTLIDEPRVQAMAIPSAKKSWFLRMYWEWVGFFGLSKRLQPDLWLSLHDITSRVSAGRQAVYCHNPSPFYRISLREAFLEPKFFLFNFFYLWLYRLLIRRNHSVVVQQSWLRTEFQKRMGPLPVVVAHPVQASGGHAAVEHAGSVVPGRAAAVPFVFLYPALPRVFKNFETLFAAARLLASRGVTGFEVRVTLSGTENRCARWLMHRFGNTPGVRFIGLQTRAGMHEQYGQASAVLFPSKLETWGLPISEGKAYGHPLLLADLPYAHEAVGTYDRVGFFPATSPSALADAMQAMVEGRWQPTGNREQVPHEPFAADWASLWALLTRGFDTAESAPLSPMPLESPTRA